MGILIKKIPTARNIAAAVMIADGRGLSADDTHPAPGCFLNFVNHDRCLAVSAAKLRAIKNPVPQAERVVIVAPRQTTAGQELVTN